MSNNWWERDGLPCDLALEREVLSAALVSPDQSYWDAANLIAPDTFFKSGHRELWEIIGSVMSQGGTPDIHTIRMVAEKRGSWGASVTIDMLNEVSRHAGTTSNIEHYCRQLLELRTRRAVLEGNGKREAAARNPSVTRAELMAAVDAEAQALSTETSPRMSHIYTGMPELVRAFEDASEQGEGSGGPIEAWDPGLSIFKRTIRGWQRGRMFVVAGPPGGGKTTFATQQLGRMASTGHPSAAFWLEGSRQESQWRLISQHSQVPFDLMHRPWDLTTEQWSRVNAATEHLRTMPIYADDSGNLSVSQIRARCRKLKRTEGLDFVVIDYLQLLNTDEFQRRNRSDEAELSKCMRALKLLAKELDIALLLVSMLKKNAPVFGRPTREHLKGSSAIEYTADAIIFFYRNKGRQGDATNHIYVDKTRLGTPFQGCRVNFRMDCGRFSEYHP